MRLPTDQIKNYKALSSTCQACEFLNCDGYMDNSKTKHYGCGKDCGGPHYMYFTLWVAHI